VSSGEHSPLLSRDPAGAGESNKLKPAIYNMVVAQPSQRCSRAT